MSITKDTSTVLEALTKKGYTVHYTPTQSDAKELALSLIAPGTTVGFGGSITTRQIGLVDALLERGHEVFDHWQPGLTLEEMNTIRLKQTTSDVFLTSANAITLAGEIINIDGLGNRVAAAIYGPKAVIVIAGMNKLATNLHTALDRIHNVAAVNNARRLQIPTPCSVTGKCTDCSSPTRICNITVIQHRRPMPGQIRDYHVIIVGEELGY